MRHSAGREALRWNAQVRFRIPLGSTARPSGGQPDTSRVRRPEVPDPG